MGTSPFKMCHAREPRKEILGEIGFVPRAQAASETEIMNLGLPFVKMCARHGKQSVLVENADPSVESDIVLHQSG
jgi:hypothetical protein